jgi:signal transduction histidine kinase
MRCERIINDLLDFTQTRSLEAAPIAVDAWLGEVLDQQKPGVGIRIERRLSMPDRLVRFDAERMRRVIVNLIENAVHAMSGQLSGGREPHIIVATRGGGDHLEILIEDNGPGIPADILPKVFEPLFSTKSFGTGLGLPTVKRIMEQHGGSIAIASTVQSGTRVTLRLPLASALEMAA